MICSPNLLKNLGIKLAMELIKEKPLSEQRLFQAIIVQALEDVMNISARLFLGILIIHPVVMVMLIILI